VIAAFLNVKALCVSLVRSRSINSARANHFTGISLYLIISASDHASHLKPE